jgi:hypothetical protein
MDNEVRLGDLGLWQDATLWCGCKVRRVPSEELRVRVCLIAVSPICSIHRASVWEFDCSPNQRVSAGPLPKMSNGLIIIEAVDEDDGTSKE